MTPVRSETVIIGGGQAGLATGYWLSQLGRPFVILEARKRIGDVRESVYGLAAAL